MGLNRSSRSRNPRSSSSSSSSNPKLLKRFNSSTLEIDWNYGRRFGIVIDAGSSGSRVQIYSWRDKDVEVSMKIRAGKPLNVLPRVEKGVEFGDRWQKKVEPGISSFATHPSDVGDYLKPLLDHALEVIPSNQVSSTTIYLLATAGMRLIPKKQQDQVLQRTCKYIRSNYSFRLEDCQKNVRVISGEEEGGFGWVAVNYLMDGFDKHGNDHKQASTYGFLDMGGASTQIAFEPNAVERIRHSDNLTNLGLRLLDGTNVVHSVFITTWLGYGTNQARERYSKKLLDRYRESKDRIKGSKSDQNPEDVPDPCLPTHLTLPSPSSKLQLRGTGDFAQCMKDLSPLLNKDAPCPDQPCLFDGKHVPPIDFSVNHFIGISEYWYSTHDVWSMGGVYDFVEFEKKAIEYCGREWSDIVRDHKSGKKWPTSVEISRLQSQCFKAAWITNILHEGIGIPRIVDKGGKGDNISHISKGMKKAQEKGLSSSPPSFQSLNDVGEVSVSWTLGMMVLEVSPALPRSGQGSNSDSFIGPCNLDGVRGIHSSQLNDFKSKIGDAANRINPMAILAMMALGLGLWFCFFCFKTNNCFFSRKDRNSNQGYILASMEEGESRSRGRLSNNPFLQGSPRLSPRAIRSIRISSSPPNPKFSRPLIFLRQFLPHRLISDFRTLVFGSSPSSAAAATTTTTSPPTSSSTRPQYTSRGFSKMNSPDRGGFYSKNSGNGSGLIISNHEDSNDMIPPVSITTSLSTTNLNLSFQPSSARPSIDEGNRLLLPQTNGSTLNVISPSNKNKLKKNVERASVGILRPHSSLSNHGEEKRPIQRLTHSHSFQDLPSPEILARSSHELTRSPKFKREKTWTSSEIDDYNENETMIERLLEVRKEAYHHSGQVLDNEPSKSVSSRARIRIPSSSSTNLEVVNGKSNNKVNNNGNVNSNVGSNQLRRNHSSVGIYLGTGIGTGVQSGSSPSTSQLNLNSLFNGGNSNNSNLNLNNSFGKGRHGD